MSQSTTATQAEFVAEEFETSITTETTEQLAREIEEIVRSLRRAINDDDLIEELLRAGVREVRCVGRPVLKFDLESIRRDLNKATIEKMTVPDLLVFSAVRRRYLNSEHAVDHNFEVNPCPISSCNRPRH